LTASQEVLCIEIYGIASQSVPEDILSSDSHHDVQQFPRNIFMPFVVSLACAAVPVFSFWC
jgi:hypothetical protein